MGGGAGGWGWIDDRPEEVLLHSPASRAAGSSAAREGLYRLSPMIAGLHLLPNLYARLPRLLAVCSPHPPTLLSPIASLLSALPWFLFPRKPRLLLPLLHRRFPDTASAAAWIDETTSEAQSAEAISEAPSAKLPPNERQQTGGGRGGQGADGLMAVWRFVAPGVRGRGRWMLLMITGGRRPGKACRVLRLVVAARQLPVCRRVVCGGGLGGGMCVRSTCGNLQRVVGALVCRVLEGVGCWQGAEARHS